jgi:DNA-binding beta-propeller fold protein YncE
MAARLRMADFSSVAVDRAGNVYVADASNNVIRVARPVQ